MTWFPKCTDATLLIQTTFMQLSKGLWQHQHPSKVRERFQVHEGIGQTIDPLY